MLAPGDNTFGPVSPSRSFDFTLLFEQSILSVIPSAVFIILAPWRLWNLRLPNRATIRSWMSTIKPITILGLITSQLLLLISHSISNTTRTRFSIPAAVLAFSAAIVILPLSYLEHSRSVRPSTLLGSFLALSILLDLPQARTLYLIPESLYPTSSFSAALAIKITLLLLETWNKRVSLIGKYQNLATESTSGILNRSIFLWMNSLFKRGYVKVISFEDLGPIDSSLSTARLHQQIQIAWKHQGRQVRWPLLQTLFKALRWSILSPVFPRLCYACFLFAQPFLINQATAYLSRPSNAAEDNLGYGLIGAAACIYLGIAASKLRLRGSVELTGVVYLQISNALFKHQLYRHITMVRGSLVSLIYTQSLCMEERADDPAAAVTLMSADVDRICQSLVLLHDLWARPLELTVGVSLLALQIGWVCVIPVVVVLLSAGADTRVTLMIGGKVKTWTDAVQRRVSLTADFLSSMKSVKMLGLSKPFRLLIQSERSRELKLQANYRWSTVWLNSLGNVPLAITAAITFITFAIKARVWGTSALNTSQVFTSLALINLVTTPASELLVAFPFSAGCLGCLERIQAHLLKSSRLDQRNTTKSDVTEKTGTNADDSAMIVARLSRVNISTPGHANYLISNLDLDIRRNTFTMILGPSGSGKSTLLRAILSETKYDGCILVNTSRIAYCPQTPWLFTGTFRQNICGLNPGVVEEAWYRSVLHTCGLEDVLLSLEKGENTDIEGQSSSLSGGQKQRITLARALYQRPRLLLLDDILSALDIKTEMQIMKSLFGTDGLLSRLGAAVVLVTHTRRWESCADNIVVLDGIGNINHYCPNKKDLDTELLATDISIPEPENSSFNMNILETGLVHHDTSPEPVNSYVGSPRHGGDIQDYVFYFKSVRWPVTVMFLLSAAAQTIFFYMSQVILVWWTADNGAEETKWLPIYILLAIGNALMFGYTAWTVFLKLVPESALNLHGILLDVVINAPYSFFTKTDVGTILNRFSQDMTLIESQLPTGVLCTLIYFFWTIGSLVLISTGSTWMALTIPAVFFTLFWLQRVYLRTSRRLRAIELELRSPVYSNFMETLKGLSTIRTLKWEDQFTTTMMEKVDVSQVPYYLLYCAQRWLQLVLDMIVAALAIVVIALAVRLRSSTDPGILGLSLNNVLSFNDTLSLLLQYWTQLEVSLGAIARTREFSHETPSEFKPSAVPDTPITQAWPNKGGIEIRDLSAKHTRTKTALNNITMTIQPGEKIGICGPSGSGKSSLLSAILRLLESSSGSITIDGVDLASLHHQLIRERLLAIPQDTLLIQHSLRFNLDPQAQHSDEQLVAALAKVSLWPALEKRGGLDANVDSDALSQGQKQLFSLARAILRKEKAARPSNKGKAVQGGVLLLDEATSNVDRATDTLVQRVIWDEFSMYTILVVAHRLDTILDSDRIAVLDAGRLVELDSPDALLGRESAFAALYKEYKSDGEEKLPIDRVF